MRELYDVHGHFLPGMDDGCKNEEESLQVLAMGRQQGVRAMFATPHYYPVEPIAEFLERRSASADRLQARLCREPEAQTPDIILGAEVACRPGLSTDPMLDRLCLGGTAYLLLELPWRSWSSDTVREVRNLSCMGSIVPVLAHLERYVGMVRWEQIEQILELDVLVQVNAQSLLRFSDRQAVKKLLRRANIHLLGSDCHNLTGRKPEMGNAAQYLEKHPMDGLLDRACRIGKEIYSQASEEYKLRF